MSELLASDELAEVRVEDAIVWCRVVVDPKVRPDKGSQTALLITSTIRERALVMPPPYRGVMIDVRKAPPVFGPITRGYMEQMLVQAERVQVPVVALVGAMPMQRDQYARLFRQCAPRAGFVADTLPLAMHWLRTRASRSGENATR